MKKLKLFLRNLPKKAKIAANLLLSMLLLIWVYLLLGSPATPETLYRRAERANLIGPGTILTFPELSGTVYEQFVLAETPEGAIVYSWDRDNRQQSQLVYRQKNQGIAILSLNEKAYAGVPPQPLPIFVFDCFEDAVRAELSLSVQDSQTDSGILHAQRENRGFFQFKLPLQGLSEGRQELAALLQRLSGNTMADTTQCIAATVRFYDREDVLLAEISTSISGS